VGLLGKTNRCRLYESRAKKNGELKLTGLLRRAKLLAQEYRGL